MSRHFWFQKLVFFIKIFRFQCTCSPSVLWICHYPLFLRFIIISWMRCDTTSFGSSFFFPWGCMLILFFSFRRFIRIIICMPFSSFFISLLFMNSIAYSFIIITIPFTVISSISTFILQLGSMLRWALLFYYKFSSMFIKVTIRVGTDVFT